ncbi:3605_t:CDS:2, partial [Dentiscutata erythropus]
RLFLTDVINFMNHQVERESKRPFASMRRKESYTEVFKSLWAQSSIYL